MPIRRIEITASVYPLAEIARWVGGSSIGVETLVPVGVEPHDFELSPRDIERLRSVDILLLNGGGLEPWAQRVAAHIQSNGVMVVTMIDRLAAIIPNLLQRKEGRVDPHIWLDPVIMAQQVIIIRDALVMKDPQNRPQYIENAQRAIERLRQIDEQYRRNLTSCALKEIITSHDAFQYLSARYGIAVTPIAGISPDEEPTPRRLAELAAYARRKKIPVIFFEELASPRIAQTLAREADIDVLVLNPIEGLTVDQQESGEDYFSLIEKNRIALERALVCQ